MRDIRRLIRPISLCIAVLVAATIGSGKSLGAQAADSVPSVPNGSLTGVAYDSTAARALSGAELGLARSDDLTQLRITQADVNGRFRFDSLAPGTYLAGATHPRLDSLGIRQLTLLVEIREGQEAQAALSVPSIPRLIDRFCGVGAFSDSSGMMIGTVRKAIPDRRAVPGTVRASWSELALTPRGLETTTPYRQSETDAAGHFIVCSAPTGGLISVRAWHEADSSGFVDVTVPANGLLLRDLYVGPTGTSAAAQGAVGIVRGYVRRPDGTPLSDARLSVSSSNAEVASADDGSFTLSEIPTGTHTLEARGVGYSPLRMPVDVVGDEVVTVSVEMEKFIALDPVMVRADRMARMRGLEGFAERREGAWGYFLDPAQIAQRNPVRLTDLLRSAPGVIVTPSSDIRGGDRISMSGGCTPQIFVDGARLDVNGSNIENLIFANDIRAVEVYNRASITPPQFSTLGGCGAIVFWTGPRG